MPQKKLSSRAPRMRIEKLMYINLGLENGGFAINLSEGGIAFHGVQQLRKDQPFQIKFTLPGLRSSVESSAQIVWLNELGKGGGLQFLEMPDHSARLIREWLALQTSVQTLADTNPRQVKPVEMRPLNPPPAIRPADGRDRSSRNIYSRALAASAATPGMPAETTKVILPVKSIAVPVRPGDTPAIAGFRNPLLLPEAKSPWRVSFSFALATGLGLATFLGVASYQLHWSFDVPAAIPNPAPLFAELTTKPTPRFLPERHHASAALSAPVTFAAPEAPVAAQPTTSTSISGATDAAAIAEPAEVDAPPAKKQPAPLNMKPPRTVTRRVATTPERVTASHIQKAPMPDVAPPAVAAPAKSELAASLPEPPAQVPPTAPVAPAPVAHDPVAHDAPAPSGVLEPAQLLSRKSPVYPPAVRAAGFFGSVELHFTIGADGAVHDVNVVKGNPLLGRAATEALEAWRYKPAHRGGVPVESESSMTFVFDSN
jgi:protein TonB